jgi:hypothetical protein
VPGPMKLESDLISWLDSLNTHAKHRHRLAHRHLKLGRHRPSSSECLTSWFASKAEQLPIFHDEQRWPPVADAVSRMQMPFIRTTTSPQSEGVPGPPPRTPPPVPNVFACCLVWRGCHCCSCGSVLAISAANVTCISPDKHVREKKGCKQQRRPVCAAHCAEDYTDRARMCNG